MIEKLIAEAKLDLAIVVDMVLGFVTGLLIIGLVPEDKVNFNVLGSVVLCLVCGAPYWVAHQYVKAHLKN